MTSNNCEYEESGLKPCEEQAMDCEDCDYFNPVYRFTPERILYNSLHDFDIEVANWKPILWKAIFDEFMERLENSGYISKTN